MRAGAPGGAPRTGSAPGKVILLGEHAAVFGHPALVAAIDRRLRARLAPSSVPEPEPLRQAREALARVMAIDPALRLSVESDLPQGAGLGSSAALAVAAARAALGPDADRLTVWRAAREVERVFHGQPSGVDTAASAWGGTILFRPGDPPSVLPVDSPALDLVLVLTPTRRRTADAIAAVRRFAEAAPDDAARIFGRLGELAWSGASHLGRGDLHALGADMNEAHAQLAALGVSTPDLDRAVAVTRAAGALGAKLTGAGLGGAAVVLCPGREDAVMAAARAAGFETLLVLAGLPG